MHTHTPF